MKDVMKKFQKYITENSKNLHEHLIRVAESNCKWEIDITKQRIDDLFILRYRLEQLLNKAGYEDLCTLSAFSEKTREELEKKGG